MVLRNSGRVGRRRFPSEVLRNVPVTGDFVFYARRENPYRIPISSMLCFVTPPRSASSCPQQVRTDTSKKCWVTPSCSAALHLLKVYLLVEVDYFLFFINYSAYFSKIFHFNCSHVPFCDFLWYLCTLWKNMNGRICELFVYSLSYYLASFITIFLYIISIYW